MHAMGDACTSVPIVTIISSLPHAAFVVVKIAPWPVLKSPIPDTFRFGMKSQSW